MRRIPAVLAVLLFCSAGAARGVTITFEDISLPPTGLGVVASPYISMGFTLTSTSGFSARGPGTDSANFTPDTSMGSGVVTTSLAAFGPATITLTQNEGLPFSLGSIDLAREFRFNTPDVGQAFPVVTFTGTQSDGDAVQQTFVADQADFFFRTFTFSSDFTDLVSVSWLQPPFTSGTPAAPAPGLHQFDNIVAAPIPEPSSLTLLGLGVVMISVGLTIRRGRTRIVAGA